MHTDSNSGFIQNGNKKLKQSMLDIQDICNILTCLGLAVSEWAWHFLYHLLCVFSSGYQQPNFHSHFVLQALHNFIFYFQIPFNCIQWTLSSFGSKLWYKALSLILGELVNSGYLS